MNQVDYKTTAKSLTPQQIQEHRQRLNLFKSPEGIGYGELFTDTQILIFDCIVKRRYPRVQLILPTQYGKSLTVALAVLYRISFYNEKWALIAPTEDKARIIMDYIIEHIFDDIHFIELLEYYKPKEDLLRERSKTRLRLRTGGEVRVFTADANNSHAVMRALTGFGAPNLIPDESGLLPDPVYAMMKRMLGGTKDNFCLEIGNPFFHNHFRRTWIGDLYVKIYANYKTALAEGRYTPEYMEEMKQEAFFKELYKCEFPDESEILPNGFRQLLSYSMIENAMISQEIPIGHNKDGEIYDKPILGIDPNHGGSNFTVITVRYPLTGFAKVVLRKRYEGGRNITEEIGNDAVKIIRDYQIDDYNTGVDAGGVGSGLVDFFERKGVYVTPVMFGQGAEDNIRYANAKAELFWRLRKWIVSENGKLVKDDGFLELKEINYKENLTSRLIIESKEDLVKRGIPSPDVADSLALTFITTRNTPTMDENDEPDMI